MAELKQEYNIDVNFGLFMFDVRDENDLSLSVEGSHTFIVSDDEQKIQACIDQIFETFPSTDKYGFKKGRYRYKGEHNMLSPLAIKILQKNGIEIKTEIHNDQAQHL